MSHKHPLSRHTHAGYGDWRAFDLPLDTVYAAAAEWKEALKGVAKPWLCWHVNDRWCAIQQRLVLEVGWTPVVGWDPQFGPPNPLPGSVLIDFNRRFNLPILWLHMPLEFAFLYTDKLAFWHADLLCRIPVMRRLSTIFDALEDGEMAAPYSRGGRRHWLNFKRHRYWEVVGCTTRGASESQFQLGTGWWQNFALHPNCPDAAERERRRRYYWDSGVGILYWKRRYGGRVRDLKGLSIDEGHCSATKMPNYKRIAPVSQPALGQELDMNFSLDDVAQKLEIAHLL
jgi:hypothetical protein